jgi:aspartate aminotransferase-like enzyme
MHTYTIPLVPGPTTVRPEVLAAYQVDYGSADLEPEYPLLYAETETLLHNLLGTGNRVAVLSGEGMVALWGALKSTLCPGDRVVAVATGFFGFGIADMARAIGAHVDTVDFDFDEAAADLDRVADAIRRVHPKMVTLVHCETPSGIINPAAEVGALVQQYDVPLYYVDVVSSVGAMPLEIDAWSVDLCLGATQKALSSLPDLGLVAVSERAWDIIEKVNYQGYDALLPFRAPPAVGTLPHTPNWHALAALYTSCTLLAAEGLAAVYARHATVAHRWRESLTALGLALFPRDPTTNAPTVTAVKVPEDVNWPDLDAALRHRGMAVGGSYGPLAGKVFRIGHMGAQASAALLHDGIRVLSAALRELGVPMNEVDA